MTRDQIKLLRLYNGCPAFDGELTVEQPETHRLCLRWRKGNSQASLDRGSADAGLYRPDGWRDVCASIKNMRIGRFLHLHGQGAPSIILENCFCGGA